jgi:predicted aspartyl protease
MSNETAANHTMGKIIVTLELTNWADTVLAERGFISTAEIRACTVDNALVETGATRLCLPAEIIQKLGLKQTATIDAQTAVGPQTLSVYEGLKLTVEGREGRYDCVELPAGQTPLLGLIPLEDLGLDPDLQNQRLRHLPTQGKETYLTVL